MRRALLTATAFVAPVLLVTGASGRIARSTDGGGTWDTVSSQVGSSLVYEAAWSPALELWVAVGNGGNIVTSPDGITWTSRTSPMGDPWLTVDWSPTLGMFIVGNNEGRISRSTNGTSWSGTTSPTSGTSDDIHAVRWAAGTLNRWHLVSSGGDGRYSTDGISWTQGGNGTGGISYDTAYSPSLNQIVIVGPAGFLKTSSTMVTWTARNWVGTGDINGVAWSPTLGMFVAVGSGNKIGTSTDGTSWTQRSSPFSNTANIIRGVTWSAALGKFFIVGSGGTIGSSTDGINWVEVPTSFSEDLHYVAAAA